MLKEMHKLMARVGEVVRFSRDRNRTEVKEAVGYQNAQGIGNKIEVFLDEAPGSSAREIQRALGSRYEMKTVYNALSNLKARGRIKSRALDYLNRYYPSNYMFVPEAPNNISKPSIPLTESSTNQNPLTESVLYYDTVMEYIRLHPKGVTAHEVGRYLFPSEPQHYKSTTKASGLFYSWRKGMENPGFYWKRRGRQFMYYTISVTSDPIPVDRAQKSSGNPDAYSRFGDYYDTAMQFMQQHPEGVTSNQIGQLLYPQISASKRATRAAGALLSWRKRLPKPGFYYKRVVKDDRAKYLYFANSSNTAKDVEKAATSITPNPVPMPSVTPQPITQPDSPTPTTESLDSMPISLPLLHSSFMSKLEFLAKDYLWDCEEDEYDTAGVGRTAIKDFTKWVKKNYSSGESK